jgi:hypothetical protein
VTGFTRTYPTLSLRDVGQETDDPFVWPMHYTQYGWPAPVILVLARGMQVPVVLVGSDPRNNQPLWFGFASGGTPPTHIGMSLMLDPSHPEVPPSGISATDTFWNAYILLPRAGCYSLTARPLSNTSDGSWTASFSASR